MFKCIEICTGAGGQALGLEMAGFEHVALIEIEEKYCQILKKNRPNWPVICQDLKLFNGKEYHDIDLLAGGVPCPPFSKAGKQLGKKDERDLFPDAVRLIKGINPKAVMLENVRGFLDPIFKTYRENLIRQIKRLGYCVQVKLLNASDFGVAQLRPRVVIVGIRNDCTAKFEFPHPYDNKVYLNDILHDLLTENGWDDSVIQDKYYNKIAPTIVGGSKKHGGPDLGPTRSKKAWFLLGVDGSGIANEAPCSDFCGMPKLTPRMLARIQGFPDSWDFGNKKTIACRMIGNALPPPVALAVGLKIKECLENGFVNRTSKTTLSPRFIG